MKRKLTVGILIIVIIAVAILTVSCGGETVEEVVKVFNDTESGLCFTLYKVNNSSHYVKVTAYNGKQETENGTEVVGVKIPSKVKIDDVEYPVTVVGSLVFDHARVSNIEIEEGITKIEPFAFGNCGATRVTLPSTVKEIGEYAFINCNSLRVVAIGATTPPELGGYAFKFYIEKTNSYEVNSVLKITVPKESLERYKESWAEYSEIISAR